jgi:hypothetical protein
VTVFALRRSLERVAVSLPFRFVVAIVILAFHVTMMAHIGKERFGYDFNEAPALEPMFYNAKTDAAPNNWSRLVVSRWDAQHYIALGMRGYQTCKDKSQLAPGEMPFDNNTCQLNFYPSYGFIGGSLARLLHKPYDYALFGVSLFASFLFLLMWTGKEMVAGLGVGGAYLSLLLLNLFSTGFTLVTVQTEPCVMALTLGAFVCLRKRWFLASALLAGAATSIRISGVATGFAFCVAILVLTYREHPRQKRIWAWRALLMVLSGWGVIALMTYYQVKFGDPLIYAHAHERSYHHEPSLAKVLWPDGRLLMQSIWAEPNDGIILAAALLWFAVGHKDGLVRFPVEAKAFWYALFFGIVGICMTGSVDYAYGGTSRYMVSVLPIFFAMAAVMRRKPAVLILWLFMSAAHYYNGGMCFYVGQLHPARLEKCSFARYFRSDELQKR